MTIFGSHVGSHIPNIGYLEVYDGIWGYIAYIKYMGVYGDI